MNSFSTALSLSLSFSLSFQSLCSAHVAAAVAFPGNGKRCSSLTELTYDNKPRLVSGSSFNTIQKKSFSIHQEPFRFKVLSKLIFFTSFNLSSDGIVWSTSLELETNFERGKPPAVHNCFTLFNKFRADRMSLACHARRSYCYYNCYLYYYYYFNLFGKACNL